MTQSTAPVPRCPPVLGLPLRALPLRPISISLTAYSRRIAKHHSGLFRRLGEHSYKAFALDPVDLPIVIHLYPNGGNPHVTVSRKPASVDCRISGPLAALIGLVHGAYDGDALFFSRELVVEGETSAALALRNAVDDAELDLSEEILQHAGLIAEPLRRILLFLEGRTGVSLSRVEEAAAW